MSPSSDKFLYLLPSGKGIIRRDAKNQSTTFGVQLGDNDVISSFTWSPDEVLVVFARAAVDVNDNVRSVDYLRLDTSTGKVITILRAAPDYQSIAALTNSQVTVGNHTYNLANGSVLK